MEEVSSGHEEDAAAAVIRNPRDFASWTTLLGLREEARYFESFLSLFPLCFGYWQKYAEMIARYGDHEKATAVFERGVKAVPLSVELWKAYCGHVVKANDPDRLRECYLAATDAVGRDPRAGTLWDSFLEFEAETGTPETVCRLYRRMVAEDASKIDQNWHRFKALCRSYKTSELLSPEEARDYLYRYCQAANDSSLLTSGGAAGYSELAEQRQAEQMAKELEIEKNRLVQRRLERQHYETGIRRWYFHVKPLDEAQLQTWRDYLNREIEMAERGGDDSSEAVVRLFERCLVPCALYAEFWIKYVYWTRRERGTEAAVVVAERALKFLPNRLDAAECLALMLEDAGRIDDARSVYHRMFENDDPKRRAPCAIALANFERRREDEDAAMRAYELCEDDDDVVAHAARYLVRVARDLPRARSLLDAVLERKPEKTALWISRVQVEFSRVYAEKISVVHDAVVAVYERALKSKAAEDIRLWAMYWTFEEHFGSDAQKLVDLKARYAQFRRKRDRVVDIDSLPRPKRNLWPRYLPSS